MSERELRDEIETLSGELKELKHELALLEAPDALAPLKAEAARRRLQRQALEDQERSAREVLAQLAEEADRLKQHLLDSRKEVASLTVPLPRPADEPMDPTSFFTPRVLEHFVAEHWPNLILAGLTALMALWVMFR